MEGRHTPPLLHEVPVQFEKFRYTTSSRPKPESIVRGSKSRSSSVRLLHPQAPHPHQSLSRLGTKPPEESLVLMSHILVQWFGSTLYRISSRLISLALPFTPSLFLLS